MFDRQCGLAETALTISYPAWTGFEPGLFAQTDNQQTCATRACCSEHSNRNEIQYSGGGENVK